MVKIINKTNSGDTHKTWQESTTLLYEITGISAESVAEQIAVVREIATKNGGTGKCNCYIYETVHRSVP
jgi:hypothetical protein